MSSKPLNEGLERFDPSLELDIWLEHWHRYLFAQPAVGGRRVLDLASGEGYGSSLLAADAAAVIGVDFDGMTVRNARERYAEHDNLFFVQADATATPLRSNSFDVVVSFETLEHLTQQQALLAEIDRVLTPQGLLLISTPDRDTYSPPGATPNPHHCKELNRAQFLSLLGEHFKAVKLWGQQLQTVSVIESEERNVGRADLHYMDSAERRPNARNRDPALYLIAACARDERILSRLSLNDREAFNSVDNALFHHQQSQLRRLIHQDHYVARLQRQFQESQSQIAQLRARLGY